MYGNNLFKCYSEINKWQQSGTITNGYLLDLQSRFNLNINQLLGVGALLHDHNIFFQAIATKQNRCFRNIRSILAQYLIAVNISLKRVVVVVDESI
ncbi:hypothetical protein [Lysinibacillus xylanilyticus]|uniref:hypothetical protein n=1 Tax=Lysinibacillus xylanilyticus TaxID=582475 RepID=UPI003D028211